VRPLENVQWSDAEMRTITNIFKDYILEKLQTSANVVASVKGAKESRLINYAENSNTMFKTADTTA